MKNIWFGIIVFLLVAGAVVYFNNNYVQPAGSFLKPVVLPQETSKINNGQIVFAKKINQNTFIQSIDSEGKVKTLFNDQNEKDKIVLIGNFNSQNLEIPVITGKSTLAKIKLDGSEAKIMLNNDFSFTDFTLSPDGKKVAYVSFSNAEREYGYSIFVLNSSNEKTLIYRSNNNLTNLEWLSSGLGFIEEQDKFSTANIINLENKETTSIYSTKNILSEINFSDNLAIDIISEKNIYKLGLIKSKKSKLIYENTDGSISFPFKSLQGDKIVFLLNNKYVQENGIIYMIDDSGKNIKKIEQGIKILGWIP